MLPLERFPLIRGFAVESNCVGKDFSGFDILKTNRRNERIEVSAEPEGAELKVCGSVPFAQRKRIIDRSEFDSRFVVHFNQTGIIILFERSEGDVEAKRPAF